MKQLFILLLLSFTLFGAHIDEFAKDMNFERDYKSALNKAKKENKLFMIVLSADYCPWCRKFEHKTLNSKLIKSKLNTEIISLVVDKKFDIKSFPAKFKTQFTPKVFFVNPLNEKILKESNGYVKKKEFLKVLNNANDLYKATK